MSGRTTRVAGPVEQTCVRISKLCSYDANDLRNTLQEYLSHYKAVLTEHGIALPFLETPQ